MIEIPALVCGFGVDPAAVLARAGLAADALDQAENRISFAAVDRLLGECVAATGCAYFGLLVGSRWGLTQFGALGELMRHCATVGEALRSLVVLQRLHSDVGAAFLLEHTRTPIDEISAALCYADVSAFMHAFRRWTGTTPARWRKLGGRP